MDTHSTTTEPATAPVFPFVSLREASLESGFDRMFLKGYALAAGVRLMRRGRSILMSREDFERLRHRIASSDATA